MSILIKDTEMPNICKRCEYSNICGSRTIVGCSRFKERKHLTNADRVRSMTNEELENWFWWLQKEMMYYTDSVLFVHEWLKQGQTNDDLQEM